MVRSRSIRGGSILASKQQHPDHCKNDSVHHVHSGLVVKMTRHNSRNSVINEAIQQATTRMRLDMRQGGGKDGGHIVLDRYITSSGGQEAVHKLLG